MNIVISNNLREESKVVFFSVNCEDYKHSVAMYLDNLTDEDIFLYIYESKYIYNGRCAIYKNRESTALTNAISSDLDKAYEISNYQDLILYFKSRYQNDEKAYQKIINDIKSKGIGIDEEISEREENTSEYIKRHF